MRLFAHDVSLLARTEDIRCDEDVGFDVFQLSKDVLRGLEAIGFKRPSPVQLRAIPYGRCGVDMVVQSKSGTGKTCVFSVVALDSVDVTKGLQAIILAPTHEIAQQDSEVVQAIGRKIQNLVIATCIGGHYEDKKKLKSCHIIIGSPGRIRYLIQKSKLSVQSVRLFVLDEADFLVSQEKMRADVNWICSALPEGRQTIALSATFSTQLSEYVTHYMDNPVHIKMCSKTAVLLGVKQLFHYVSSVKFDGSYSGAKFAAVKEILGQVEFRQCIIFYNNHEKAESLSKELIQWKSDWPVAFISSQIEPTKRSAAFAQFRQGKCKVLVSSDLICRGADAKDVDLVLHLDFPRSVDTYLHRVGRAGRFGGQGVSIGIVALSQEFDLIQKYQDKLKITIPQMEYPPPNNLVTSSAAPMPSCRVGDIVTVEKIETGDIPKLSGAPCQPADTTSPDINAFRESFQVPSVLTSYEDEPGGYSDMLASYEEVDRFLNLDSSDLPKPTMASSSSKTFKSPPTLLTANASLTGGMNTTSDVVESESSKLAQDYRSLLSKTSASLDSLVKAYACNDRQGKFTEDATESRSTSSATVTVLKDNNNDTMFTPTPTPNRCPDSIELISAKAGKRGNKGSNAQKQGNFCDSAVQTDDRADFGASTAHLPLIPIPPLMTMGGYSEFAEWLQLHGSLIYAPQTSTMTTTCRCSCHCD